jgi:hypothetical protein
MFGSNGYIPGRNGYSTSSGVHAICDLHSLPAWAQVPSTDVGSLLINQASKLGSLLSFLAFFFFLSFISFCLLYYILQRSATDTCNEQKGLRSEYKSVIEVNYFANMKPLLFQWKILLLQYERCFIYCIAMYIVILFYLYFGLISMSTMTSSTILSNSDD